jgi:organic radical activating enzyme
MITKHDLEDDILTFSKDRSFRYFKTKGGLLVKSFLNTNRYYIESADDDLPIASVCFGEEIFTNDELDQLYDIINQDKKQLRQDIFSLGIFNSTCNVSCEYCTNGDRTKMLQKLPSIEQLQEVFNTYNIKYVSVAGGEPLVEWPQLKNILTFLDEQPGIKTMEILSNGRLLKPEILEFISSLTRDVKLFLTVTTKEDSKDHMNIQELYELYPKLVGHPVEINIVIDHYKFDVDRFLSLIVEMVKKGNFGVTLNAIRREDATEEGLLQLINNVKAMIRSPHIRDLSCPEDDNPTTPFYYATGSCSSGMICASSKGYSFCLASMPQYIEQTVEGVKNIRYMQSKHGCESCDAYFDDVLCKNNIFSGSCYKLERFNCLTCPNLCQCQYQKCYYLSVKKITNPVADYNRDLRCIAYVLIFNLIDYIKHQHIDYSDSNSVYKIDSNKIPEKLVNEYFSTK